MEVVIYNDSVCSLAFVRTLNVYHHVCAGWPEDGRGSCQVRTKEENMKDIQDLKLSFKKQELQILIGVKV